MYLDLKTDDRALVERLVVEHCESAELVQITMNKLGDLYQFTLVQKAEPPSA